MFCLCSLVGTRLSALLHLQVCVSHQKTSKVMFMQMLCSEIELFLSLSARARISKNDETISPVQLRYFYFPRMIRDNIACQVVSCRRGMTIQYIRTFYCKSTFSRVRIMFADLTLWENTVVCNAGY